ncbi:uncharacterized protein LOC128954778 isoform X2 [Oppia nitens]|nr:uncharacterized protein LOC128954778 isoform X2 [Oppia nitens]
MGKRHGDHHQKHGHHGHHRFPEHGFGGHGFTRHGFPGHGFPGHGFMGPMPSADEQAAAAAAPGFVDPRLGSVGPFGPHRGGHVSRGHHGGHHRMHGGHWGYGFAADPRQMWAASSSSSSGTSSSTSSSSSDSDSEDKKCKKNKKCKKLAKKQKKMAKKFMKKWRKCYFKRGWMSSSMMFTNISQCTLCWHPIRPLVDTEVLECGHLYHRKCLKELFGLSARDTTSTAATAAVGNEKNGIYCVQCKQPIDDNLQNELRKRFSQIVTNNADNNSMSTGDDMQLNAEKFAEDFESLKV